MQGHPTFKGERNFYFGFLLETVLLKNEILYFLHNNARFINFAYVFTGTHVSFLCRKKYAVAHLLLLILKTEEIIFSLS